MRCDYCNGKLDIAKFKYKGKTPQGKRKQTTFKLCLTCQAYGIASSKSKIYELWNEEVKEDSIMAADGSKMYTY